MSGGTNVVGATEASASYRFAEGTVRDGFIEYLTLQNPGVRGGSAVLSFQAADDFGAAVAVPDLTMDLLANSRATVNVNQHLIDNGVPTPVNLSVAVDATVPVVAERPMYFDADPGIGAPVNGGTNVVGARLPALRYSFAEGTVRPGFIEYLTLQNPGLEAGEAVLTFPTADDGGTPVTVPDKVVSLPANSRVTIDLSQHVAESGITFPVNLSVGVESTVAVVAERPVYFLANPALGQTVGGGTNVVGFAT